MKYDIKMSCGHIETHQLWGGTKDREYRIQQMEKYGLCKACYEAAELKEVGIIEEKYNLPDIIGTEKQIAWARKIRTRMYKKFEEDFDGKFGDNDARLNDFKAWLKNKTEAKWFINNKDETSKSIIRQWKQG